MMGRPPKPTALKILEGNPGRRDLNEDEPEPDELSEEYPEELIEALGRKEWDRAIVPQIRTGQITAADRAMAVAHCQLYAAWRSQLIEGGMAANVVTAGKNNYPMPNPAVVMANKTLLLMVRVDGELGLTPSSRSRVKVKNKGSRGSQIDKRRAKFFAVPRG